MMVPARRGRSHIDVTSAMDEPPDAGFVPVDALLGSMHRDGEGS